jgi:hypothetical protein
MSGTNSLGGSGAGSAAADAAAYAANQADSTLQNYTGPSGAEMAAAESALNTVDPNAAAPTNPVNGNLLGIYNPVTAAADAALLGSGALRNTTPVETMPVNTILDGSALTAATEAAGNATGAASGATGATGSTSATGF